MTTFADLKPGDTFVVKKIVPRFQNQFGFWGLENQYLTVTEGNVVKMVNGTQHLLRLDVWKGEDILKLQAVELVEPVKATINPRVVAGMPARINGSTGTDPEIFVVRGEKRKSLLPAWKFLPPQKLKVGNTIDWCYRDGFAGEIGVRAEVCHGYLIDNIRGGLLRVETQAKKYDATAKLTIKNAFPIGKVLMSAGSDEEVALGCERSLNAYDDNPILPVDGRTLPVRFAGGHVHLGIHHHDENPNYFPSVVKGIDSIAGVAAVALFASFDHPGRRRYYGRAGEYRLPNHGLEYRVLSNGWIISPEISHLVLNLVRGGAKIGAAGLADKVAPEDSIRSIINECDVKAARKYVNERLDLFHSVLVADGTRTEAFKKAVEGGVEEFFPDDDIPKYWKLHDSSYGVHSDSMMKSWGALCRKVPS